MAKHKYRQEFAVLTNHNYCVDMCTYDNFLYRIDKFKHTSGQTRIKLNQIKLFMLQALAKN